MCNNTFVKTEKQFQDVVELMGDLNPDHTPEEVLVMATNYTVYFNSDRSNRVSHTDVTTPCQFHLKEDGTPFSIGAQKAQARRNLEAHVGMAKPFGARWHVAHLCENCSSAKQICVNPEHLYFATPKENHHDVDRLGNPTGALKSAVTNKANKTGCFHNPKVRHKAQKLGGIAGSRSQMKSGNHNTMKKDKTCKYCFSQHSAFHINQHEARCAKKRGLVSHMPRATRTNPNPEMIYFPENLLAS
jgi:hypothetical protein